MSYAQDPKTFRDMMSKVFDKPDIRQKMENAEVSERKMAELLDRAAPDIWAAAASRIGEYNDTEKKTTGLEAEYESLQQHKPFYLSLVEDILPAGFGFFILSLFSLFSSTVRHFIHSILVDRWSWTVSIASALACATIVIWSANRRRAATYKQGLATAKAAREASKQDADTAKLLIEPAVIAALESHVREYLDAVARPAFQLDLPDTDTAGLSEVHNEEFEIITDGRRNVRGLIEKMSGGSIGIAGPRGCGKTTLLRSFWKEGVVDPKKLSIFASAPIKYEPREFLLHLFTSVCSCVIAKETKSEIPPAWTQMDGLRKLPTPRLFDSGVVASLLLTTAVFLLFTGLVVAIVGSATKPPAPSGSAKPSQNSQNTETPQSSPFNAPAIPYLIWGVAALIIGAVARFSPGQPKPTGIIDFYFSPWVQESRRRRQAEEEQRQLADLDPKAAALMQMAQRSLLGLRFQQSYSSGWSGSLKLPIGIEGGANAAVSFAETQLSLPELVEQYRKFLGEAAKRYDRILIAIDELDKLASDQEAKTFLNSIKAIFGQEKVYYLVSISENAMSNFERRGLPIRDEFDSSFDDAIYIGYLNVAASHRLLARRIAEPPPYVYRAFCHVLSGGLPRDLIRSCRRLYDYRRANPTQNNCVAANCPELVRQDVKAKLDAIRHNLQSVPDEKKTADILSIISANGWDQKALQDAIVKIDRFQSTLESEAARKNQPDDTSGANLLALANILEEINAYLCFSFAVTDTFASITSEVRYNELENSGIFDRLATARQWMSVNRAAAIATISQIVKLPAQQAAALAEPAGKPPVP